MPKQVFGPDFEFLRRSQLLTFEEITRLATIFADLGVRKLRLTGGEPLLRRDVERLVSMLRDDRRHRGHRAHHQRLAAHPQGPVAGRRGARSRHRQPRLDRRRRVSLDERRRLPGRPRAASRSSAARAAGLGPIKVNAVVKRGLNDEGLLDMAEHFRGTGHILRLIEFMDVGTTNGWRLDDVVGAEEMIERISGRWPLEPLDALYPGEVARRYRYADGQGEIGVIASVTQPFCGGCTRARLSAEGRLYTCLFGALGHDLRSVVRAEAGDAELNAKISAIWNRRGDRYSEVRSINTAGKPKVEMSHIGG